MDQPTPEPQPQPDELIPPGCSMFFTWIFINSIGLGIGWAAGWWASFRMPGPLTTLTIGAVTGLVQGFFQWLVLKAHGQASAWWIPATAAGWAFGFWLGILAVQSSELAETSRYLITGAITGLCLGISQWLILKRSSKRAFWWIPATVFALSAAFMFYRPNLSGWGFYYGLLYGIPTTVALIWTLYTEMGTKPA